MPIFFSTSYKYVDSKYGEDIAQLPRSESVSARIYNGILINLNFTKENFTFLDGWYDDIADSMKFA